MGLDARKVEDEAGKLMRKKNILFSMAVLAVFILAGGCSGERKVSEAPKPEKKLSTNESDIKQEVYSFRVEGFDKSRRSKWGIEGASATVMGDRIDISGLKAIYYGENTTFTIFADSAIYDKKTQDVELMENVVGRTETDSEIVTDYAKWNTRTEEIMTDSHVVVKQKNITCSGKGMLTKSRLKNVRFQKEVKVNIAPDKIITCDGPFELNQEENTAIFNKNVKIVEDGSVTLADKMTVYLNPDTNEIERVITEGNVEIVRAGDDVEKMGSISF